MRRSDLEARYTLNEPVTLEAIRDAETREGLAIPPDYVTLLQISNGLETSGRLQLYGLECLAERNRVYEVAIYLPGYLMIGDDSGGDAILMREGDSTVFEVGMGAMDVETMRLSAPSLSALLIKFGGRTLGERS